jgi:hypothetical protein
LPKLPLLRPKLPPLLCPKPLPPPKLGAEKLCDGADEKPRVGPGAKLCEGAEKVRIGAEEGAKDPMREGAEPKDRDGAAIGRDPYAGDPIGRDPKD